MTVESDEQLEGLRAVGRAVAVTLRDMIDYVRPGITTAELDAFGARRLEELGAVSAPRSTYGFPGATCISVNEGVAHGVPGLRVLCEGDVVNIDVSAELGGYWADNGATTVVGEPSAKQRRLLEATRAARDHAIAAIRPGVSFNVVGQIFELHARRARFTVIKNLCSHGIGLALHEEPSELTGYPRRGERRRFHEGQVLAIEPFFTTGRDYVVEGADEWTLYNVKDSISAQFEHTIIVRNDGPEVLTHA